MQVYRDLFTYRSGIYEHLPISEVERTGFHSVRIIGWGEEEGVKYWVSLAALKLVTKIQVNKFSLVSFGT